MTGPSVTANPSHRWLAIMAGPGLSAVTIEEAHLGESLEETNRV